MKHIYSFHDMNEANEAGFLQRDPMVGVKDLYSDILKAISPKLGLIDNAIKKLKKSDVQSIKKWVSKAFDTDTPSIDEKNIRKLLDVLNDESLSKEEKHEKFQELTDLFNSIKAAGFEPDEKQSVKLLYWISKLGIMGLSFSMTLTLPIIHVLSILLNSRGLKFFTNDMYVLGCAIIFVLIRVNEVFGYDLTVAKIDPFRAQTWKDFFDEDDVTYRPKLDIRQKKQN